MKHLYKRINRGIVLGVVLLMGLAVFIWQDESNFQKETPAIQQTVTSYMDAVSKINTFDTQYQKIGTTVPKSVQVEKQQAVTKVIDQYWVESEANNVILKSSLLDQVKTMVTDNSKGAGYVQKFSVQINGKPTIQKDGPGSAKEEVQFNVVIEYAGSPSVLLGEYVTPVSQFSGYGKRGSSVTAADTTRKRYTLNMQTTVQLEKVGGTWKISSMSGGYGSNGEPVTIE